MADTARVGLLWRAEWDRSGPAAVDTCRLHGMFAAFSRLGVAAEAVVYSDDAVDAVRTHLLDLDGVLVWVNPIEQGLDRSRLDPVLREARDAGVWVSADPDVILKIATKKVLVDTAEMSWSAPATLYGDVNHLRTELPDRLGEGPIVLKQRWGMGGEGVWKVERESPGLVRVQHAVSGSRSESMSLDEFVDCCEPYFRDGGVMVEQPFQPRLAEGMIRVYLSHDTIVGFAHQYPRGLLDPDVAARLPTEKVFHLPSAQPYQALRQRMEAEWLEQLQETAGLDRHALPVIWDADFLFGARRNEGAETYVLCEINASSTFAFPEHAMPAVAQAALDRIRESR